MTHIIEQLIIALLTFLASIAGAVQEQGLPEPTTAVIETTTAWVPEETAPPQTAPQWQNNFRLYRVNGVLPPYEWQWYLYGKLADRGLEWFYPVAVAQIYQESNWNQWADNGRDRGLCQQKAIYWETRAAQADIPGADIWSPYAQIHVYVWMMAQYIEAAGWSVEGALSIYFLGHAGYSAEYVGHVMKWLNYLEVME